MRVTCPTCKKDIEWDTGNPRRPFCSERCKLIDLGAWANEEYRVPAEEVDPNDIPAGQEDPDAPRH
ncbi:DNA gyrase inhibitor YacG [Marinobacter nanhaiticus D15-8W]|uniref:DNA gyrase inhibitor YacG n=1 Tax=Marinobacter nanhaiticus D15-8W TaxID=626887 RepID=N6VTA6_9GAMM|nr:DNA gyrase inhibitor YacG [Marinobacter nanhaiticus]ENO13395.1 DNA gyrase inhibitor YacG [Marinobacter nanhaiticus D15-8W]BES70762.1 DNA gyrase inhibitor YacG [Marinobacter nanhaiticus D15-8W]